MRISVITPYYKEPIEMLNRCNKSVMEQSVTATHIFVADGFPNEEVNKLNAEHYILPSSHHDYGGTPRALAALSAFQRGSDAVCFLDADNWYMPDHLEKMVSLHIKTGADICTSRRNLFTIEGDEIPLPASEDTLNDFADTNCLWMTKSVMTLLPAWIFMGNKLSACGDFIFYQELKASGLKIENGTQQTVCYCTRWAGHYEKAGLKPPANAERKDITASTCAWFRNLSDQDRASLQKLFLSNLDIFEPDNITKIDEEYLDIPDGTALKPMNDQHIYTFSAKENFHIPKTYFSTDLAFSGIVVGIAAMDDKKLKGEMWFNGRKIELNNDYYFEYVFDWTRTDYNMKFTLDAGKERKLKIAWWIKPFSWSS